MEFMLIVTPSFKSCKQPEDILAFEPDLFNRSKADTGLDFPADPAGLSSQL